MRPHGGACSKVATDPCKIGVVAFDSHRLHDAFQAKARQNPWACSDRVIGYLT